MWNSVPAAQKLGAEGSSKPAWITKPDLIWKLEDNFQEIESLLSLYHVHPKARTQAVRFSSRCLSRVNPLVSSANGQEPMQSHFDVMTISWVDGDSSF